MLSNEIQNPVAQMSILEEIVSSIGSRMSDISEIISVIENNVDKLHSRNQSGGETMSKDVKKPSTHVERLQYLNDDLGSVKYRLGFIMDRLQELV